MPTATKAVYFYLTPTQNPTFKCVIPAASVGALDASAAAGGFYLFPDSSGTRINWATVLMYQVQ